MCKLKSVIFECSELVNRMYGIFGTAAIDWLQEEEIWDEFVIFDTPTVMVFKEDYYDEGHKYIGAIEWNKISKFASDQMQSFVSIVHNDNYDSFITREQNSFKTLLFTNKKSPTPLIKSLSKTYIGKILFGYVRNTETELVQKFKIEKFPTLVVVTDPLTYQIDKYEGEYKLESLKDFYRPYAYYKKEQAVKTNELSKYTLSYHEF